MTEKIEDKYENKIEANERRMYTAWLCSVPGMGEKTIQKLLGLCADEKEIYNREDAWVEVLNKRQLEEIRKYKAQKTPEQIGQELVNGNISFVAKWEGHYPKRLQEIPDPPYGIFYKGRLPAEDKLTVAVVGARDCSPYGEYVAKELGSMLGENDVQVVSGMARGIDGISQYAALERGGVSFGVLGSGVDVCYPQSNMILYKKLDSNGGILSTYPPGTLAKPVNFPPRNRIVSGLSDALIVVEARNKSGTLITVDMALEQGKDVFVVPGRVTDRLSDGCNRLIKQGAGVLLSPEDFLTEMGALQKNAINGGMAMSISEKLTKYDEKVLAVFRTLTLEPQSTEELLQKSGEDLEISEITMILMRLCMEKIAVSVSPGYYSLSLQFT